MKTKTKPKPPKVRMVRPGSRPIQLRYSCPTEGREIRISTNTRDEAEALEQKQALEAKLLLGIDAKPRKRSSGPNMLWADFREEYASLQLSMLRDKSAIDAESRLAISERILKPRTLADVANADALHRLQTALLAGAECRQPKTPKGQEAVPVVRPRSAHTVKTHMSAVLAALNWAKFMGWLPTVPSIKRVKVSKLKQMKGRPLTAAEFDAMIEATVKVTGERVEGSWHSVLNGLWESGLRLGELLSMTWDQPNTIRPVWQRGQEPVLEIPAPMQKNDTEEAIPMLPGFEALLLETPEDERTGWIFNPRSLQYHAGRAPRHERHDAEWVGKVITRIGKQAGIVVDSGDATRSKAVKYGSAHDLRRSCSDRLYDAGVPEPIIQAVMRHADAQTTRRHYKSKDVQKTAKALRATLGATAAPCYVP